MCAREENESEYFHAHAGSHKEMLCNQCAQQDQGGHDNHPARRHQQKSGNFHFSTALSLAELVRRRAQGSAGCGVRPIDFFYRAYKKILGVGDSPRFGRRRVPSAGRGTSAGRSPSSALISSLSSHCADSFHRDERPWRRRQEKNYLWLRQIFFGQGIFMTATKSITLTGLIPLYRLRVLVTKREALTKTLRISRPRQSKWGAVAAGEAIAKLYRVAFAQGIP